MPRAILFDVDGTLIDSNQFHVLAWAEALRAAGHEFRLAALHEQIGQGADNYVRALLPAASDDEVEALGKAHKRLFQTRYSYRLQAFPHARDLLRRCKEEGLVVMLATSSSKQELDRHLDVLGSRDLIDGCVSADDVEQSKPCPDLFEAAATKAGVAPGEALVVGDTPFDMQAAKSAGMTAVAVRSGLFRDDQLAGAAAIYDDVADLLERFEGSPLSRA